MLVLAILLDPRSSVRQACFSQGRPTGFDRQPHADIQYSTGPTEQAKGVQYEGGQTAKAPKVSPGTPKKVRSALPPLTCERDVAYKIAAIDLGAPPDDVTVDNYCSSLSSLQGKCLDSPQRLGDMSRGRAEAVGERWHSGEP